MSSMNWVVISQGPNVSLLNSDWWPESERFLINSMLNSLLFASDVSDWSKDSLSFALSVQLFISNRIPPQFFLQVYVWLSIRLEINTSVENECL